MTAALPSGRFPKIRVVKKPRRAHCHFRCRRPGRWEASQFKAVQTILRSGCCLPWCKIDAQQPNAGPALTYQMEET
jgi:hypothetical protein